MAESKAVAHLECPLVFCDALEEVGWSTLIDEMRDLLPSIRLGFVLWVLASMLIFLDIRTLRSSSLRLTLVPGIGQAAPAAFW